MHEASPSGSSSSSCVPHPPPLEVARRRRRRRSAARLLQRAQRRVLIKEHSPTNFTRLSLRYARPVCPGTLFHSLSLLTPAQYPGDLVPHFIFRPLPFASVRHRSRVLLPPRIRGIGSRDMIERAGATAKETRDRRGDWGGTCEIRYTLSRLNNTRSK